MALHTRSVSRKQQSTQQKQQQQSNQRKSNVHHHPTKQQQQPSNSNNYRTIGCCYRGICSILLLGLIVTPGSLYYYCVFILQQQYPSENSRNYNNNVDDVDDQNTDNDNPDIVPIYQPTNTACKNTNGILHIAMGDIGGAAGTIFFQFMIGQILYAERYNLTPWIHLNNISYVVYDPIIHGISTTTAIVPNIHIGKSASEDRPYGRLGHFRDVRPGKPIGSNVTKQTLLFSNSTGIWKHYFLPVSSYVPGDTSCYNKDYITLNLKLITPGIHGFSTWAPKCWRYQYLPDYITKPHIPITEWLEPQRYIANRVIHQYIRFRPYIKRRAKHANPNCNIDTTPCLGLHIRHSDKASGRRIVQVEEFLPYVEAFVQQVQSMNKIGYIYLATDSKLVLQEIEKDWSNHVRQYIRTLGPDIIRSSNEIPVFNLSHNEPTKQQHHRINIEVLIDIVALSTCQFLIHGFSAVSESSIWMNINLHNTSINLEDPEHMNTIQFQQLVDAVLSKKRTPWPRPIRTQDIWPELYEQIHRNNHNVLQQNEYNNHPVFLDNNKNNQLTNNNNNDDICNGYDGVLHIASVGISDATGSAFFTSILNQLLYATKYNLMPWIHLKSGGSYTKLIYDDLVHNKTLIATRSFSMMHGMSVTVKRFSDKENQSNNLLYPDSPGLRTSKLESKEYIVDGTGIWNHYFKPVSNFSPGNCPNYNLVEMEPILVSPGLSIYCPWSIRAWRYDNLPEQYWWNSNEKEITLKEWYKPIREKASQIVQQYYKFQPYIIRRADQVNPARSSKSNLTCLGLHLRNSDKFGKHRAKVEAKYFKEYVQAYLNAGGRILYLATDSHRAYQYVMTNFMGNITTTSVEGETDTVEIRSQGKFVVRSHKDYPSHFIGQHHQVNSEVLVDILALSRCRLLLHTYSTVAEAAIYFNPSLHENSVNLEDPNKISANEFENLVFKVVHSTNAARD